MNKIKAILFALAFACNIALAQNPCPFRVPVGEAGLRKYKATKKVKPIYPAESLKNNIKGIVVADILVDEYGKVIRAEVKEAPDTSIKQSVIDAVKQWEFQPPPKLQGKQVCYESTLSFKFEIEKGKGKVSDAPVN